MIKKSNIIQAETYEFYKQLRAKLRNSYGVNVSSYVKNHPYSPLDVNIYPKTMKQYKPFGSLNGVEFNSDIYIDSEKINEYKVTDFENKNSSTEQIAFINSLLNMGFNCVRLLVSMESITLFKENENKILNEEKNKSPSINEEYLNGVAEFIKLLKSKNFFIILDFHQDLYSRRIFGNGMPDQWLPESIKKKIRNNKDYHEKPNLELLNITTNETTGKQKIKERLKSIHKEDKKNILTSVDKIESEQVNDFGEYQPGETFYLTKKIFFKDFGLLWCLLAFIYECLKYVVLLLTKKVKNSITKPEMWGIRPIFDIYQYKCWDYFLNNKNEVQDEYSDVVVKVLSYLFNTKGVGIDAVDLINEPGCPEVFCFQYLFNKRMLKKRSLQLCNFYAKCCDKILTKCILPSLNMKNSNRFFIIVENFNYDVSCILRQKFNLQFNIPSLMSDVESRNYIEKNGLLILGTHLYQPPLPKFVSSFLLPSLKSLICNRITDSIICGASDIIIGELGDISLARDLHYVRTCVKQQVLELQRLGIPFIVWEACPSYIHNYNEVYELKKKLLLLLTYYKQGIEIKEKKLKKANKVDPCLKNGYKISKIIKTGGLDYLFPWNLERCSIIDYKLDPTPQYNVMLLDLLSVLDEVKKIKNLYNCILTNEVENKNNIQSIGSGFKFLQHHCSELKYYILSAMTVLKHNEIRYSTKGFNNTIGTDRTKKIYPLENFYNENSMYVTPTEQIKEISNEELQNSEKNESIDESIISSDQFYGIILDIQLRKEKHKFSDMLIQFVRWGVLNEINPLNSKTVMKLCEFAECDHDIIILIQKHPENKKGSVFSNKNLVESMITHINLLLQKLNKSQKLGMPLNCVHQCGSFSIGGKSIIIQQCNKYIY